MITNQLSLSFTRYSDEKLLTFSQFVYSSVFGNSYFPTPTPTLPNLNKGILDYQTAWQQAQNRDTLKASVKNDKKQALIGLLIQLKNYVELTANDNVTMLQSSGFDLIKKNNESVALGTINTFSVKTVNPGEVKSSCNGVKNVKMYFHCYTPYPYTLNSEWTELFSTTREFMFTGLQSTIKYVFRIKAIGTNNQTTFSGNQILVVQ